MIFFKLGFKGYVSYFNSCKKLSETETPLTLCSSQGALVNWALNLIVGFMILNSWTLPFRNVTQNLNQVICSWTFVSPQCHPSLITSRKCGPESWNVLVP